MSLKVKSQDTESSKLRSREGSAGSGNAARAASALPSAPAFVFSLEDAELKELLRQLDSISCKLSMFPTEKMMYEYRRLVGELLRRSMEAFHLRKDLRWRRSDKNLYVTIERIECDLNELEEVFEREGLKTRGLYLMEEIKGCLISLLI